MAGVFFASGEQKKRAGVYQRYEKNGITVFGGTSDGIVAAIIATNWGALNTVTDIENGTQAAEYFGTTGNTFVIDEAFTGGARIVRVVRVGTGGTAATATLKDNAAETPADAVEITAKYMGTRKFSYTVRAIAGDADTYEFVLTESGRMLERFSFPKVSSINDLIAVGKDSKYMTFKLKEGYTATDTQLATVAETAMTSGTNPTTQTASYAAALTALEPVRWNTLCIDSNDTAVHALVSAYMKRTYQDGKTGIAVIAEPTSVTLATRQSDAKGFNSYHVAYVGGGWFTADDILIDGFRAGARIAGMIANISSAQSITHKVIANAGRPAELLTNSQYESCIDNGMITFAQAPSGAVWIDSGINTLVAPSGEDDDGWKKIKRTKIRFELMDRVNDAVAPLIGNINNDADGRATIVQVVQGILNAMVAEKKLISGATVILDPGNTPIGDSAWFVIQADDIDSLEKVYFTYKFRFAAI